MYTPGIRYNLFINKILYIIFNKLEWIIDF
jgi:hypothetical protein